MADLSMESLTPLDTAVAVPATTAVVAAVLSKPGPRRWPITGRLLNICTTSCSLKSAMNATTCLRLYSSGQRLLNHPLRDAIDQHHPALRVDNGVAQARCPCVLEQHHSRRRVVIQRGRQLLDVVPGY